MSQMQFNIYDMDALKASLHPAYYVGFLHSCIVIELRKPDPDTSLIRYALDARDSFIREQRMDEEDDGLLPLPVFWTDLEPAETSDLDEVLALAPVCQPFLLCSSVAPHARWAAKLHMEENEPVYFPSREAAERECDDAMEEGRRERARLIEEAFAACAAGDIEKVDSMLDDAGFSYSIDYAARTLTIEDRTEPFGEPQPLSRVIEEIIVDIMGGWHDRAETLAFRHNLSFSRSGTVIEFAGRHFNVTPAGGAVEEKTDRPDDGA